MNTDRFRLFKTELVHHSTNRNWKGGRYIADGYVMRKVKYHPKQNARGYVPEHRLVMEGILGRYLKPDEYIHHKNGDKADNSPNNLELMYSQSKHAAQHVKQQKRSSINGRFECKDKKLQSIKVRLYNKNRGDTKEYSLSQLINTTFRNSSFEYRGMSTGLRDKNGTLIFEGDEIEWNGRKYRIRYGFNGFYGHHTAHDSLAPRRFKESEVIGTIHDEE